ncbi:MAG: hypothetical protein K6357_08215 [Elusimicrobiota bacterium]
MKVFLGLFIFLTSINYLSLNAQFEDFNKIKETISVPIPKIKEWTVAIYINGKNNVDMFAYKDFNRIETQGSDENINIVAELGRAQGFMPDENTPEKWSGVRRYYIKKDLDPNKINSDIVLDRKDVDMGNWEEAASFIRWAKTNYPAKKFMFIIWNHGWGWIDPVKEDSNLAGDKSISHDFTTNNYIKTTELKKIFQKAGKVDIYASMACFMQMAEVVTEIKDYADIIVGSEEVIQLPSFNWEDFFALLKKYPKSNEEQLGIFLVDTFKEMYQRPEYFQLLVEGKYGTQLSAIRSSTMNKFLTSIKNFSNIIPKLKDIKAISKAKKDVLRFEVGELDTDPDKLISFYADIYNFLELIDKYYSDKNDFTYFEFQKEFLNFKKIIKELVIKNVYLNKDRTGKDFSNTHGISMHIPGAKGHLIDYYQTYNELEFEKITRWSDSIKFLENIE